MLKHRDAYERTKKMIEGWKTTYAEKVKDSPQRDELIKKAEQDSELIQIEESLREFEDIVNGKAKLQPLDNLDDLAPLLIKWRTAKGWSIEELAKESEVDLLELLAYEANQYEGCKFGKMRNIKDTLKFSEPKNPVNNTDIQLIKELGVEELPFNDKFDEWAELLLKWRYAKQWSLDELAEKADIYFFDYATYEVYDFEDCLFGVMRKIKEILKNEEPENPVNELDGPWEEPRKNKSDESTSTTNES